MKKKESRYDKELRLLNEIEVWKYETEKAEKIIEGFKKILEKKEKELIDNETQIEYLTNNIVMWRTFFTPQDIESAAKRRNIDFEEVFYDHVHLDDDQDENQDEDEDFSSSSSSL